MAKPKPQSSEVHPGPGFRIRRVVARPDAALVEAFTAFETPDISDLMNRFYTISTQIRNVTAVPQLLGTACTVKVYPGDNLMVHKALDIARPGDVIVVDTSTGLSNNGIIGDTIATKAKHRGIAGFVIDGLVRDIPGIRAVGLPVFAKGITPQGPLHRGPGEINFPINCGGVVVHPGDIIFGDDNGIVVIPQDYAAELLEKLRARREALRDYLAAVQRGDFSNAWVDAILSEGGCEYVD